MGNEARSNLAHIRGDGTVDPAWNPDADGNVSALARASDGTLYVGGAFLEVGSAPRSRIAALDGTTGLAKPWNPGANDAVEVLCLTDTRLYAAGSFTSAARCGLGIRSSPARGGPT